MVLRTARRAIDEVSAKVVEAVGGESTLDSVELSCRI